MTVCELTIENQFKALKKGDLVICEFHRNIHDMPKTPYRIGSFTVSQNKESCKEIILKRKNNIYFNYEMFLNGESNLKSIILITE